MILHEDGIEASIRATVEERAGKIRGATFEVSALIEDFRMAALGGLMGAWILWEKALIPSLLAGCCNWVRISQKTVDMLDEIQNQYVRVQMKTPQTCPKVILRADPSFLGMKHRVWKEKLLYVIHLKRLGEQSLAKEIYKEQREQGWPGLAKEVSEICQKLGLEDLNEQDISKETVNEEIFFHHYKEMKEDMDRLKKLEDIKNEDFRQVQEYMKCCAIEQARLTFSLRSKMYDCRANYHGKFDEDNRGCPACLEAGGQDRQGWRRSLSLT